MMVGRPLLDYLKKSPVVAVIYAFVGHCLLYRYRFGRITLTEVLLDAMSKEDESRSDNIEFVQFESYGGSEMFLIFIASIIIVSF
jgi:hypothetical protein